MAVGLHRPDRRLAGDQPARHGDVALHEDGERQAQALDGLGVQALDLGETCRREAQAAFDLLGRELHQVAVDDVADMLEIGGEGQDLDAAMALLGLELLLAEPRQIELDRLVQRVDRVVRRLDLLDQRRIAGLERIDRALQHGLHRVTEPQRLAGGTGQRHRWRCQRSVVEVARCHQVVGGGRAIRHEPLDQPCDGSDQRQHQRRQRQIEGEVHVQDQGAAGAEPVGQQRRQPGQRRQRSQGTDAAHQQIAQSRAAAGGAVGRGRGEGCDGSACIGAQDERDRHRHRQHAGADEPGQGEDHGDGRVREPSQHRRQHGGEDDVVLQRPEHGTERRRLPQGLGRRDDETKRQHDDPDTDQRPADLPVLGGAAGDEQGEPGDDQERRQPAQIDREQLGCNRRADIRAEHHGQRCGEPDHLAIGKGPGDDRGRRAALQRYGDQQPGAKGAEAIAGGHPQHVAQGGAQGARHTGAHHAHTPEQQRDAAQQLHEISRWHSSGSASNSSRESNRLDASARARQPSKNCHDIVIFSAARDWAAIRCRSTVVSVPLSRSRSLSMPLSELRVAQ